MRAWRVGDLGLVATFEKRWHENLEGRICFVSDLGLVATHFCDKTWVVEHLRFGSVQEQWGLTDVCTGWWPWDWSLKHDDLPGRSPNLSSDSPGSHAKVTTTIFHTRMQISHATPELLFHLFSHAHRYCQELHRLYLPHLPYSTGSQVFQPCNDLRYLPKI